jgi:hypothetical protein
MKVGYGFTIPTSDLVPVPPPTSLYPGFRGFDGAWEDWCDIHYWTPENNAKCRNCPIKDPIFGKCLSFDPATVAGRLARGLPSQTDLQRLGPAPTEELPLPEEIPADGGSWFEKNKMLVLAGGGVLALGAVAFAMSKRRGRRMNGLAGFFGLRHKKRRTRKGRR